MSSSFIQDAAREALEAQIVPGDAAADALLAEARQGIYHWPVSFAGFTGALSYFDGDEHHQGSLECRGSRDLTLNMPEGLDSRWLRFQLEELTSHREAPEVSKMASRTGCALGDWDPVYGRRVDFLGDKMSSFYRLKDGKLCQIGRSYKSQDFVINIDAHQQCDGRWVAVFYSAYYWGKDGKDLIKTETYLDRYQAVDGIYLPTERRVSVAEAEGLRTRALHFSEHRLLPSATD